MPDSELEERGTARALSDIKKTQKEIGDQLQNVAIQLARLDERQQETTNKVNLMATSMTNQYVGSIEFGILKAQVLDHKIFADQRAKELKMELETLEKAMDLRLGLLEKNRESDRTWFIRLTIGGLLAGIATLLGLKTGKL